MIKYVQKELKCSGRNFGRRRQEIAQQQINRDNCEAMVCDDGELGSRIISKAC